MTHYAARPDHRNRFGPIGLAFLAIMAVGACLAASLPAAAQPLQKSDVERIVKSYLLAHPQVIEQALTELAKRREAKAEAAAAKSVSANAAALFNSPHQEVVGNPKGKITLVEFFDYNCPHCRNVVGDIGRLIKANPDLRLVLKDFPILTPQSVRAAHVAIALRDQFGPKKYWRWYKDLMTSHGLVGRTQALVTAKQMGANLPELVRDANGPEVDATLKQVAALAQDIHAEGTPTFVLGDKVFPGEMTFAQLNPLIANMRKCGKDGCS